MPAIAASRALAPQTSASTDSAARVAVSLSILSWLTVVIALFWR
ncbi:hypothetical protein RZN05_05530 [Sphingomonas sp. HF-S4]|uniref:Uncharacterized protein n=1 Tax=Sphingomonas agrestis TaxID=3080540 RepID=A0ABU3Y4W8_9SPHN|nr:hypothetical protein [Sphingomonas sp. HF-S4]MDV3456436.1 hypothetical protein [Sphingomonas sp. HF-S4]